MRKDFQRLKVIRRLIQVADEIPGVAGSIDIAESSSQKIHALLHALRLTLRFAGVKGEIASVSRRRDHQIAGRR